ncbi:MAG: HEAT repeat domain-containing protein, partial [Candidatus Bilamarchaeaceae archaeon]
MNNCGEELYKRIRTILLFRKIDEVVAIGKPAVPALIDALKDKNEDVRYRAAWALGKIGFDKIPIESKVLALLILGEIDKVVAIGKPVVPVLIDALKDKNEDVRENAAE